MKKFSMKKSVLAVALVATFTTTNANAWEWFANDHSHKFAYGSLALAVATSGVGNGALSIIFGILAVGKGMEIAAQGTPAEQVARQRRADTGLVFCSSRIWHESNTGQLQGGEYSRYTTDYDKPAADELSPITQRFSIEATKRYLKKSFADKCDNARVGYTTDNFRNEFYVNTDSESQLSLSCTAIGERGNPIEIQDLADSDVVAGASYHFLKNGYIVKNRNGESPACVDVWADDWAVTEFLKKEKENNKMD